MNFDVIIVGGGLIGCASAYYLSQAGMRALLIEAEDLNRQASGRNAGSLHFQLEHRLLTDSEENLRVYAQILPLNIQAMEDWASLPRELGEDIEVKMDGGLMVAETDADLAILEQKYQIEKNWDFPSRILSTSEVRNKAPYLSKSVRNASFCAREGSANPRLVTHAYARNAVALGATIYTQNKVVKIEQRNSGWKVFTEDKDRPGDSSTGATYVGATLLNAAGAWAGHISQLAGADHEVTPMPLLMNVTDRTAPFIPHLVQHVSQHLSLKQVADGNVLIGGGWPSHLESMKIEDDTTVRPTLIPDNIFGNLNLATSVVPRLVERQLIRCWTGIASLARDQLPLLGKDNQLDNYFIASSGSAFTLGPTFAKLISKQILDGAADLDISLYDPNRTAARRQKSTIPQAITNG